MKTPRAQVAEERANVLVEHGPRRVGVGALEVVKEVVYASRSVAAAHNLPGRVGQRHDPFGHDEHGASAGLVPTGPHPGDEAGGAHRPTQWA